MTYSERYQIIARAAKSVDKKRAARKRTAHLAIHDIKSRKEITKEVWHD